ncbi:hypothetical protein WJ972_02920 [Achromobacter insuavis]
MRDENRALRELLAAQVQASIPRPGLFKRLGWALISAPGAALVGWRSLIGREDATPITGKRVGYATLTVLYTLAIYGALVLLVVSWSTPNAARTGVNAAGPVRVPLDAPPSAGQEPASPATPTDRHSGDGAAAPPRKPSRRLPRNRRRTARPRRTPRKRPRRRPPPTVRPRAPPAPLAAMPCRPRPATPRRQPRPARPSRRCGSPRFPPRIRSPGSTA